MARVLRDEETEAKKARHKASNTFPSSWLNYREAFFLEDGSIADAMAKPMCDSN
jgi:hypothetical protein